MNSEDFSRKYSALKTLVFRICFSYLRNVCDSEDAMQDTFLKYYLLDKEFETELDEKRYLIRIAVNCSMDILRKRKPNLEDVVVTSSGNRNGIDSGLLNLVLKLKPIYREVIILKYVEEMEYEDIAALLKVSIQTVRKRAHRALDRLKLSGGVEHEKN